MKKQNGITLIALIITIIVMLILVGVTINVALNGGLFGSTEKAVGDTQIEAEREQLLSAVVAAYETETGTISKTKLESNLGEDWNVGGEEAPYTVTSPKGNKYTVNANGTIDYEGKEEGKDPSTLSDLEKYILGADGKGRILMGEDGIIDSDNFSFKDDPLTANVNETETLGVEFLAYGPDKDVMKMSIYAKYKNKAYKIICDITTSKSEELEVIYEPKGKEGQKTAEGWTILYDNGSTAEAVSPTTMGELRLGYAEGTTDSDTQLSQAIESYNSAITIINNYCKNLEGLPTNSGVRSVGAAVDTTTAKYSSENLKTWNSAYNGVGLEGDTNYEQDLVRMAYWGVNNLDNPYWTTTRIVGASEDIRFHISSIHGGNAYADDPLWIVNENGDCSGCWAAYSVRPIITIGNP